MTHLACTTDAYNVQSWQVTSRKRKSCIGRFFFHVQSESGIKRPLGARREAQEGESGSRRGWPRDQQPAALHHGHPLSRSVAQCAQCSCGRRCYRTCTRHVQRTRDFRHSRKSCMRVERKFRYTVRTRLCRATLPAPLRTP